MQSITVSFRFNSLLDIVFSAVDLFVAYETSHLFIERRQADTAS